MSIHLNKPLIRITPHYSCNAGIVISGYITGSSHTYLKVSGVSLSDINSLSQAGIGNKISGGNAYIIDLTTCDYSEID